MPAEIKYKRIVFACTGTHLDKCRPDRALGRLAVLQGSYPRGGITAVIDEHIPHMRHIILYPFQVVGRVLVRGHPDEESIRYPGRFYRLPVHGCNIAII